MLVAFTNLLRRSRHGSVRHQLTGAALQSATDCISVDLLPAGSYEGRSLTVWASDGASASTSFSACPSSKPSTSLPTPTTIFGCLGLNARHASSASESHTARRREILRDAAQKVSPGSTWLLAYSHNIDPRQLTYRLGKRSTLHALQEGWALYQPKFDTVAMAALLRRLRVAQLYDPDFDPVAAQRLLDALEPRLRSITIRFGKLRDTIAYLHALAKLRSPPPKAPFPGVAGLPEGASAAADDAEPAHSSSSSAGGASQQQSEGEELALLGQPSELVLDLAVWATRDRTQMLHASPRRLATLLWALMRTLPVEQYGSEKLQMVLDRVALCSIRQWRNLAPQDMRIYAVAFATFGPRGVPEGAVASSASPDGSWGRSGRSWLGSVTSWPQPEGKRRGRAAAAGGEVGSGSEGAGAKGGSGGGDAGAGGVGPEVKTAQRLKRNALVMKVVADHLAARVGDLTVAQPEPRDLALAAHALALQGAPEPHWPLLLRAADTATTSPPHSLQPLELVLLVEALAKYGVRQPKLMEAVRQRAQRWAEAEELQQLRGRLARAYERLGVAL